MRANTLHTSGIANILHLNCMLNFIVFLSILPPLASIGPPGHVTIHFMTQAIHNKIACMAQAEFFCNLHPMCILSTLPFPTRSCHHACDQEYPHVSGQQKRNMLHVYTLVPPAMRAKHTHNKHVGVFYARLLNQSACCCLL